MDLKGKKVIVVGLGRSGVAAANLLVEKGAKVRITESLDNPRVRENIQRLNRKEEIHIEIGRHSEGWLDNCDLVVTSPGVAMNSWPIVWAKKRGLPIIGEIELAFAFCSGPIIAITGTNGKTTVTTLIGQILRAAGYKSVVCGNIGNPFCAELTNLTPEHIVVLEVSSFQLETIDKFKPKVAVILNLTKDHLDRYTNLDEYVAAKVRLFLNQDENDWAVLNEEDPYKHLWAAKTEARVVYFSKNNYLGETAVGLNPNHFAVLAVTSIFSVPQELAIACLRNFKGLEHRLEEVAQFRGVKFINDSKATNVDSALWALNIINEPIILIAGGKDKGSDFSLLNEKIKSKVRAIVLLGEAKEKIKGVFGSFALVKEVQTLTQAVGEAFSLAQAGDCVLLSPMCASFDMFTDYEHRGRVFKQAVQSLIKHNKL